jgi:hypothetical protein
VTGGGTGIGAATADGVCLAGAAQTQRDLMGYALRWPAERDDRERALDADRVQLAPNFGDVFEEGRTLSIDTEHDLANAPPS